MTKSQKIILIFCDSDLIFLVLTVFEVNALPVNALPVNALPLFLNIQTLNVYDMTITNSETNNRRVLSGMLEIKVTGDVCFIMV